MITEAPEQTRDGRWIPTRAGILNVWRYYDEVFTFHNGRLLLRGRNGTGKSKALELLLPFLLDASLRPNRLSTFGGNERVMHWNMIGHGYPGASRVGYVWLEFKRVENGAEHWFTCGARLQATRDTRQVHAAYFTCSGRVGHGISLVTGDGAPLTRDALRKALGTAGTVHSGPDDYRARVRGMLYPSLSEARYDSLITALLQLRTPKLSERLDPALLSDLLSSALPPLGRGELADIADGFERLDRQREELADLAAQVEVAERLAARQRTYARHVLRAGAARLISATTEMDRRTREETAANEQRAAATTELDELQRRQAALKRETAQVSGEISGLRESEAFKAGADIDRLREQAEGARIRAESLRSGATRRSRQAAGRRTTADELRTHARSQEQAAVGAYGAAARAAERIGMDNRLAQARDHAVGDEQGVPRARRSFRAALDSRSVQIAEVRQAVADHRAESVRLADLESDLADASDSIDALDGQREEAGSALEAVRTRVSESLEAWALSCVELQPLDTEALESSIDGDAVGDLVATARMRAAERLTAERTERARDVTVLRAERDELAGRLAGLRDQAEVLPPVPYARGTHRDSLPGAPLWRLVRFTDGVQATAQAGLEAALEASGLLDAWILPDGTVRVADDVHDVFGAPTARVARGRSLLDVLEVEDDAAVPTAATAALLASVAVHDTIRDAGTDSGDVVICLDGGWRTGPLWGRWAKPEPSYVGAAARERARRAAIGELTADIGRVESRIGEQQAALSVLDGRRDDLAEEVRRRPSTTPLAEARRAVEQAERALAILRDSAARLRTRVQEQSRTAKAAADTCDSLASHHRLPVEDSALSGLASELDSVRALADTWLDRVTESRSLTRQAEDAEALARESEEEAHESAEAAVAGENEAALLAERFSAVESTLGVEHREVVERIGAAEARLRAHQDEAGSLHTGEAEIQRRIGKLEQSVISLGEARAGAVERRDTEAERLRTLMAKSLRDDAGIAAELAAEAPVRATQEAARAIAAEIHQDTTEERIRAAFGRLSGAVYDARQTLAGIELELDAFEDVHVLSARVNGLRMGAARLRDSLHTEQQQRATDLSAEERALFDRTLTGDTRRHLADRIRQADALVEGMNRRLQQVRTASRISVRLRWRVAPDAPEGTAQVRDLLLRSPQTLDDDDRDALHRFFRDRIDDARSADTTTGWEEHLMEVLDYTRWHRFTVELDKADGRGWQELTRRAHGQLSGGEKAIALHLPLFAAVAAHYESDPAAPRFILLDEVFVGVDTTNRGQVFALLGALGLDLVLTSDHEWCTYAELDGIAIHQLIPGDDDDAVTSARWVWTGADLEAVEEDTGERVA
ncbi:TIGR02680 family protein [Nocardiopsis mangrovi]|uniref:TIGR02680 family protein n=1 Tax=Nocardiopsis mangrovi TaxID=1179818 RepID=A0ABV9DWR1_9ACTN